MQLFIALLCYDTMHTTFTSAFQIFPFLLLHNNPTTHPLSLSELLFDISIRGQNLSLSCFFVSYLLTSITNNFFERQHPGGFIRAGHINLAFYCGVAKVATWMDCFLVSDLNSSTCLFNKESKRPKHTALWNACCDTLTYNVSNNVLNINSIV